MYDIFVLPILQKRSKTHPGLPSNVYILSLFFTMPLFSLFSLFLSMFAQRRYNVGRVIEFYAATEGNVNLFNSTGKQGALGYIPVRIANALYPLK